MITVCKNCTDRHMACHDHCERYQTAKAENDRIKTLKRNDINNVFDEILAERKIKRERKYKR